MKTRSIHGRQRLSWPLAAAVGILAVLPKDGRAQTCASQTLVFDGQVWGGVAVRLDTPPGCTEMLVKIWGGGGGLASPLGAGYLNGDGGGGGAVIARVPVHPAGEAFRVQVPYNHVNAAVGGLAAWIYPQGANPETGAVALAAGGGAGGRGYMGSWQVQTPGHAGAGGAQAGKDSTTCRASLAECRTVTGGGGATQSTPGLGGTNNTPNGDGKPFDLRSAAFGSGGRGYGALAGSGGDGWFGGGGGGYNLPSIHGAGGGGGANYVVPARLGRAVERQLFRGSDRRPGNYADPDRLLHAPCSPEPCGPGVGRDGLVDPHGTAPGRVVVRFEGVAGCTAPPTVQGQMFWAIDPCRVVDTRVGLGSEPIGTQELRRVQVTGACTVPPGAEAVAINVTAVAPPGAGDLRVFPGCLPATQTSVVNFAPGLTRINNAVARLGPDGELIVKAVFLSDAPLHFTIDVAGYFLP
jgi:hypothetical protein